MAKSMRSKREKRLRAIRREIVEPFYEKNEAAKLVAQAAALAAPKVPVRTGTNTCSAMDTICSTTFTSSSTMDVEMGDNGSLNEGPLKPSGGIGKKSKRKFKVGRKGKRHGKGKFGGKYNI